MYIDRLAEPVLGRILASGKMAILVGARQVNSENPFIGEQMAAALD